ncbi:SAF domain-containing protein [Microbacterium sp. M3]|uniref:SAF domain-containing protein n=1 Tax=Microbacterium arthrosphaerae TaxID=792652 RepID=A0ABU4H1V9_9MICO|nr:MULTISPECIES: SAF domain-containing protein [Microbacterium]MDW4573317.1 SAF domain-containing protein [Microbacterium arthrosphaerae]MDW7607172.1 SAF domain-containing protein [Microbacterium sp. M3]
MTVASDPHRSPRRAFWGDARFFLGVLLVAASVIGVWLVVTAARQTVPVYAAAHTIVPGEAIGPGDLEVVDVALGELSGTYLAAGGLGDEAVATRTIEAGELVPAASVGQADEARTTSVVVRSAVDVPASVEAGTVVEVWTAPLGEDGGYDEPRVLVADATVVSVTRDDSMIGGGAAALELVIPRADVSATLAAMADESALSIVPTAGAGS